MPLILKIVKQDGLDLPLFAAPDEAEKLSYLGKSDLSHEQVTILRGAAINVEDVKDDQQVEPALTIISEDRGVSCVDQGFEQIQEQVDNVDEHYSCWNYHQFGDPVCFDVVLIYAIRMYSLIDEILLECLGILFQLRKCVIGSLKDFPEGRTLLFQ